MIFESTFRGWPRFPRSLCSRVWSPRPRRRPGRRRQHPRDAARHVRPRRRPQTSRRGGASASPPPPTTTSRRSRRRRTSAGVSLRRLISGDFWFPASPADVPLAQYFPERAAGARVEFLDVGCGYGSLLLELAAIFPALMLGVEIRPKVVEYVQKRVIALRHEARRARRGRATTEGAAAAAAATAARVRARVGDPQQHDALPAQPSAASWRRSSSASPTRTSSGRTAASGS